MDIDQQLNDPACAERLTQLTAGGEPGRRSDTVPRA